MEWIQGLVSAFLSKYSVGLLYTSLAAVLGGVIIALVFLAPKIKEILVNLADKIKSEKIRLRVKDAIDKLDMIVQRLVESESQLYRKEVLDALKNDGIVDNKEFQAICEKLAQNAMSQIAPDINTLKNFFVGEKLFEYILNTVKSFVIEAVNKKLGEKALPFATSSSPKQ